MRTTSSMEPCDIMRRFARCSTPTLRYEQQESFLLLCVHGDGEPRTCPVGDGGLQLPRLSLNG
ncbi:hypothetical protein INR49_018755, partial [Caranx melampygus]